MLLAVGIQPAERNETNRDAVEKFASVQAVSDPGDGIDVGGELDPLKQMRSPECRVGKGSDFSNESPAQSEDDVAILVSILENRVAAIGLEAPARSGDNLVVTIERLIGGDEIQNGLRIGRGQFNADSQPILD